MATAILNLVIAVLQATVLVVTEIFEGQKRARIAGEKYEVDKAAIRDMLTKAIDRLRSEASRESQQAVKVEDEVDEALRRSNEKH